MKYCSNCGQQNAKSAKFCLRCGNPFEGHKPQQTNSVNNSDNDIKISDRDLLTNALTTYEDDYSKFKKKWTIVICISILFYLFGSLVAYLVYTLHFKPKFEKQLVERYKKENHIS